MWPEFASIQSRAKRPVLTSDGSRPAQGHETVQGLLGCGGKPHPSSRHSHPPTARDAALAADGSLCLSLRSTQIDGTCKGVLPYLGFLLPIERFLDYIRLYRVAFNR